MNIARETVKMADIYYNSSVTKPRGLRCGKQADGNFTYACIPYIQDPA